MRGEIPQDQKEQKSPVKAQLMAQWATEKIPTRTCSAAFTATVPGRTPPAKEQGPNFCICLFSSLWRNCSNRVARITQDLGATLAATQSRSPPERKLCCFWGKSQSTLSMSLGFPWRTVWWWSPIQSTIWLHSTTKLYLRPDSSIYSHSIKVRCQAKLLKTSLLKDTILQFCSGPT